MKDYDKMDEKELSDEDIEQFQKELEEYDTDEYDDTYIRLSEELAQRRSMSNTKRLLTKRKNREARMVKDGY
jgi:hypothetical protein